MYFLAGINCGIDDLVSAFAKSLQRFAATRVRALISNVPVDLTSDPSAYFGSVPGRPVFDLVFTIHLRDKEAIPTVREAQNSFEQTFASQLNLQNTWIAFGQRAVIFDQDGGIEVCLASLQSNPAYMLIPYSLTLPGNPVYRYMQNSYDLKEWATPVSQINMLVLEKISLCYIPS
jgi:hypothetical protein